MEFDIFLKVRVSFYFTGFKKAFSIYLDIDAGFYLEAAVKGQVTYDITTDTGNVHGGISVEFGLFVKISINVNILGLFHPSWTFLDKKLPLFKMTVTDVLDQRVGADTIELDSYSTPIIGTELLTYLTFDHVSLAEVPKGYLPDSKATLIESCFCDPLTVPLFADFKSSDSRIKIIGNDIIVNAGTSELNATISYTVFPLGYGTTRTEKVNVHFRAKEARDFSIDGKKITSYLPGQTIELPKEITERDGYIFKGYVYNGENITSMDTLTMGNENINISTRYIENRTYTVKYYDGLNNLVYTETVLNEEKALGPDAITRDANMEDGFVFIGWDRNTDTVTKDMEVHAIYLKGSEII